MPEKQLFSEVVGLAMDLCQTEEDPRERIHANLLKLKEIKAKKIRAQHRRHLVVSKFKCESCCPTACGVCFDIPQYQNVAYTQCNHYICKTCLDKPITKCVVCQQRITTITMFRPRKTKSDRTVVRGLRVL